MTATVSPEPRAATAGYWGRARCLHVIDLESLVRADGAPPAAAGRLGSPPEPLLRLAWSAYRQVIGIQRGDHAVLGLRSALFADLSDVFVHCNAQLRVAAGPAGVRSALLDAVDVAHAARRFDWLVIAGGHREFAELASAARTSGMRVWLVGGAAPFPPALAAMRARRSRLHLSRLQPSRAAA
jgi:hypothetical protein